MVFKIDFIDGKTISWKKGPDGADFETHPDYHPRFYIEGDRSDLQKSRVWLTSQEGVVATCFETWKPTLSKPEKKVLRVDVEHEDGLKTVVNMLKKSFGRSRFRFYNVGFSPQFRFCLQNEICPLPENQLEKIELGLHRKNIANSDIRGLKVNGEKAGETELEVLAALENKFSVQDPDMILVNRGELLDLLNRKIEDLGIDFHLGRRPEFQTLAGENTVSSYGRTIHSSARYNIPGRAVIDRSNSFILGEATFEGMWDLVERSYRPIQELAWGSIGRLLTSIEIRHAYLEENTLTPWKNWSGEKPKAASKLHKADRGGFIFNPRPSIHEDVYEADFASLFPNIMVNKNISPETVCCDCCDNNRVPELDYSICEEQRGFISKVLEPLVKDRQEMKERVAGIENDEERRYVQGSIDAIKWLLVSCFGYMGHSHASYGAIRCHQAIQAFDRKIMVKTKDMLEEAGYSIAHGIIDSIWAQKKEEAEDFEKICRKITEEIGIELEPEHRFEWCAFVPRSSSKADIATLNQYFGKTREGDFKTAGIETEQRSSCEFVKETQMEMIRSLDRRMEPQDVIGTLQESIRKLENKEVSPDKLVIEKRVSQPLEAYSVENRNVAAIKRARRHGIDIQPGQHVRYIVRDDSAEPMNRVRLEFEREEYDASFYTTRLVRATESVLSPLGWNKEKIEKHVSKSRQTSIID